MTRFVVVHNCSRTDSESLRVKVCASFRSRLKGLMFRRALGNDEGLLLIGGRDTRVDSAIHMLFVPFDLSVFWIDSRLQVVDAVIAKAWRPAYIPVRPARYVLELHPDRRSSFAVGDKVEFADA